MPLNDFQCRVCNEFLIDVYQPVRGAEPPMCPKGCVAEATTNDAWPPVTVPGSTMERLWSAGSSSAPFQEITVEHGGKTVILKSMRDVRKFEHSTTEAWLRGEPGAQPMIFRNFSQDHSNRDSSPIEQHFSDRVRHQRPGDPRNRPEMFSKTSGRRKIDIQAIRDPRERREIMLEHGFIDED